MDYLKWDEYYRRYPLEKLGWELDKPRPVLVEYMEKGLFPKGEALDLCCGAGTNTVYIAENGFDVVGIDISKTAIQIAKQKAYQAHVNINFLNESFIYLSFRNETFNSVWDMGCFHHIEAEYRLKFIAGVYQVLKNGGVYMLTCFSYRNGPRWNHFTKQQLVKLFSERFEISEMQHYPSLEGDGVIRFFYTVVMRKK